MKTQEQELPFVVECNMGNYFEPIAAFNSESVAKWYSGECAKTNPQFRYHITTKEGLESCR